VPEVGAKFSSAGWNGKFHSTLFLNNIAVVCYFIWCGCWSATLNIDIRLCFNNLSDDIVESFCSFRFSIKVKIRFSFITAFRNFRFDRHLTEERNRELKCQFLTSAAGEYLGLFSAIGTNEAAHIFNDTGYRKIKLIAEGDTFFYINSGYFLGRGDYYCAGLFPEHLGDG